jgi:hypothetical protein
MTKYLFSREGLISVNFIGAAMIASNLHMAGALLMIGYMIIAWTFYFKTRGLKAASRALAPPSLFIFLIAVPSFLAGYDKTTLSAEEQAWELVSQEQTFSVLCKSWRDGTWIDRTIGQYSDRGWCKDYVHRLPPVSEETTASIGTTGKLWK